MPKETLLLFRSYVAKAARRMRSSQPHEILPLLRTEIARIAQDVWARQSRQMVPLLENYYLRTLPEQEAPKISNFRRNSTGWENETYTFTLAWGAARHRKCEQLILCIYPGSLGKRKADTEYQALNRLAVTGYPVPRVKHYAPTGDLVSRNRPFLILERADGCRMWKPLANAAGEERARLLAIFCGLLTRLHAIDWRIMVDDPATHPANDPSTLIHQFLADQQTEVESTLLPGFETGWEWILAHGRKITSRGSSIVHFDFHPDNLILEDHTDPARERTTVIDWTSATVTDYRFDLAWTLLLVYVYTGGDWRASILSEYECQSGQKVENIEYFEAVACYARLLRISTVMTQSAERAGLRPGAKHVMLRQAPVIRRVYSRYQELTGLSIPQIEQYLNRASA